MRKLTPLLVCVVLAPAWTTFAQDEEAAAGPPSASPYIIAVRNGIRLAMGRDYQGAQAALREAVQENPSMPHAYYYMAETHRLAGNLDGALEQFRRGASIAQQAQDDMFQGRCLKGVAETLERKEGALQQAREAWNEYARFADSHRMVSNPEIARARIQAIDQVLEMAQPYAAVRERIAARERQNRSGNQRRQGN